MVDIPPNIPPAPILCVSELNQRVRRLLEGSLPLTWVAGEISNLSRAASGHLYFTLKDENAQARCAVWRNKAQLLGFRPENGQHVEARVLATFYEARGDFQLNVETLRLSGQGQLFERFLALKARLEGEGLFSPEKKRPLPAFPRRLAIVTSPKAAALKDVLATLGRRAPHVTLTLFPAPVQGEGAGAQIARALALASASGCEAILLCRGGGGMEDLWAFNEEVVARAIRAATLPVVSGVGHETDFTIADFAADLRAPTPTSAAEQVCPDRLALLTRLDHLRGRLRYHQENRLRQWDERLDNLAARMPSPARQLSTRQARLAELAARLKRAGRHFPESGHQALRHLAYRLQGQCPDLASRQGTLEAFALRLQLAWRRQRQNRRESLARLEQGLRQLDPHAVLARGYALVFDATGRVVRDARALEPEALLEVRFAQGRAEVQVTGKRSPR
jgi:exodeoxyribonuclease VII large subunit